MSNIVKNRYKKTSVKTKRYVIRSLNTFSQQYKVACIKYVDLNYDEELIQIKIDKENPLTIYFDERCDGCSDLRKDNEVSGVIWDYDIEKANLSNYILLLVEVDNLISINKKYKYKDSIKKIIRKMVINNFEEQEKWKTIFFEPKYRDDIIFEIEEELKSHNEKKEYNKPKAYKNEVKNKLLHIESKTYKTLATKIYTQLKNRVRFPNAGVYHKNDSIGKQSNILIPIFITSYDKLKSRIEDLLREEWLLSESILSVLRAKLQIFEKQDDICLKINELDILENISIFYGIKLHDTNDNEYIDAIELLKYYYLEEMDANNKYKNPYYKPYAFELLSQMATEWEEVDALRYIESFNYFNEDEDEDDIVEKTFNEEQELEQFNQLYNHPIDSETFNDNSLKDIYRENASSIDIQWNKYYDVLLDGILSKNINENRYYELHISAIKILDDYNILFDNKVYHSNGSIDETSLYLQDYRKELNSKFKNIDKKKSRKKISQLLAIKKKEWKLLYKTINENSIFYALEYFDYKRLEFREF